MHERDSSGCFLRQAEAGSCAAQADLCHSLASEILGRMTARSLRLATAESCTGGLLAKIITDVPGASAVFTYGLVTYSNAAKQKLLHVPEQLLSAYGAVSPEVARAMAEGAREIAESDIALATTGIAGPDGATPQKPLGLVFIGLAVSGQTFIARHTLQGSYPGRSTVRKRAACAALDMAAKFMAGQAPPAEYITPCGNTASF